MQDGGREDLAGGPASNLGPEPQPQPGQVEQDVQNEYYTGDDTNSDEDVERGLYMTLLDYEVTED